MDALQVSLNDLQQPQSLRFRAKRRHLDVVALLAATHQGGGAAVLQHHAVAPARQPFAQQMRHHDEARQHALRQRVINIAQPHAARLLPVRPSPRRAESCRAHPASAISSRACCRPPHPAGSTSRSAPSAAAGTAPPSPSPGTAAMASASVSVPSLPGASLKRSSRYTPSVTQCGLSTVVSRSRGSSTKCSTAPRLCRSRASDSCFSGSVSPCLRADRAELLQRQILSPVSANRMTCQPLGKQLVP